MFLIILCATTQAEVLHFQTLPLVRRWVVDSESDSFLTAAQGIYPKLAILKDLRSERLIQILFPA